MPRKTLASVLHEVDPKLKVVSGSKTSRKARATVAEFQSMAEASVEERIRSTPAPRRLVRELDWEGNPEPSLVCPRCSREVEELFPYGFAGKRFACTECIQRRKRTLEQKARIFAQRREAALRRAGVPRLPI